MLSTDLLPHLTSSFDQFVLHQCRVVIVRLEVELTVVSQAHQARPFSLLLPRCAEVAQDVPVLGLGPGLTMAGRATRSLRGAGSVQIQSAGVRHFHREFKRCPVDMKTKIKPTGDLTQQQKVKLLISKMCSTAKETTEQKLKKAGSRENKFLMLTASVKLCDWRCVRQNVSYVVTHMVKPVFLVGCLIVTEWVLPETKRVKTNKETTRVSIEFDFRHNKSSIPGVVL